MAYLVGLDLQLPVKYALHTMQTETPAMPPRMALVSLKITASTPSFVQ